MRGMYLRRHSRMGVELVEVVAAILPEYFVVLTASALVGFGLWIALSNVSVAVRWLYTAFSS